MDRKKLIKKLDKVFSLYIRKKNSMNGMVRCYTCNKWVPINEITVGHFIKRQFLGTRYDERNVKPQCRRCNYFLQGNDVVFAEKLKEEYGESIIEKLYIARDKIRHFYDFELMELYKFYSAKLEEKD